eukprot:TRINITY_DN3840_c0_g1_i4.p1 TRINITY_DN3840_c0_g1~~TRINITY_DN3840_c0_g1_i4.p1  ORF type:complete len:418 (-),score=64.45 TRINITY_DN3840_c0_g1_i4:31-1284(-)
MGKAIALMVVNAPPSAKTPWFSYSDWVNSAPMNAFQSSPCSPQPSSSNMQTNLYFSLSAAYDLSGTVAFSNDTVPGYYPNVTDVDKLNKCGFAMDVDRVDVNWTNANIWSWDMNFPEATWSERCAFLNLTTQKIQNTDCFVKFPFSCRSPSGDWQISNMSSVFMRGFFENPVCPPGYKWRTPSSGLDLSNLLSTSGSSSGGIWLNYSCLVRNYCWGTGANAPACPFDLGLDVIDPFLFEISFNLDSSKISGSDWDSKVTSYTSELSQIAQSIALTYMARKDTTVSFGLGGFFGIRPYDLMLAASKIWSSSRQLFNNSALGSIVDFTKPINFQIVNTATGEQSGSFAETMLNGTILAPSPAHTSYQGKSGLVVVGVIGGLLGCGLIASGVILVVKRRQQHIYQTQGVRFETTVETAQH